MASKLYRLGFLSFRRRRLVLLAWLAALIGLGVAGSLAGGTFSTEFRVPGTESQQALEQLEREVPQAGAENASARLVFSAAEGEAMTAADRQDIAAVVERVGETDKVASATDPYEAGTVSKDGRTAFSTVTYAVPANDLVAADRERVEAAAELPAGSGVSTALSSTGTPTTEAHGIPPEVIGVGVAVLVLALTFGSLLAAGLPLLTAFIGVGVGLTSITLLSAFTDLSDSVTSIAAMLGLAVGIDYALFILSRHRSQAQQGMGLAESAALAVGTAGSAVVFAGATVIIALAALAVTGVPFLAWMGVTAAFTVAIAVLVAITLVPALLGFAGERAIRGKRLHEVPGAAPAAPAVATAAKPAVATATTPAAAAKPRLGARWIDLVLRHRVLAVVAPVLVTVLVALPATHLRLGLPDDSVAAKGTQERIAYDQIAEGFGPGFSGPLVLVADVADPAESKQAVAALQQELSQFDGVAYVAPGGTSADGGTAILSVIPESGPSDDATVDLVKAIRAAEPELREATGASVAITGQTAINIDVADKMGQALPPYMVVVVGLALVLLTVAFRSLLVPLTAVAGFLLTIGAALVALVAVFQDGFGAELLGVAEAAPIVSLIPILMIGILFGLAMDYQVFLVSRMHEAHAQGAGAQQAVREGSTHSARVVTAAALIMVSVFAGFVLPDDPIIKSIGFALTVGILVDAFLIRMTLIPALMSLMGARAWALPSWLDRKLPDVDIEGRELERRGTPEPAAA